MRDNINHINNHVSNLKHYTSEFLVLIDGTRYISNIFSLIPSMKNKNGTQVNALFGFTKLLMRIIDDFKPKYMGVVFDSSKISFRNNLYAYYKPNKSDLPNDLIVQFSLIKDATEALSLTSIEIDNFEANDLIATFSKMASLNNVKTIVVSDSKNLIQLLNDNTIIFDPIKLVWVDSQKVFEEFGVYPEKFLDAQSLAGNHKYNIPGVPGIGIKSAANLINEFGDLEQLLLSANKINENKKRENLVKFSDQARLSKELFTLKNDVTNNITIDCLKVISRFDKDKIKSFFEYHGFKTLLRSLNIVKENEGKQNFNIKKLHNSTHELKGQKITLKVNIVGIKHRNIDVNFLKNLKKNSIVLKLEPSNEHDIHAIKCIKENIHFGYIEKAKSEYVTLLFKNLTSYNINVLSYDEFKVQIEISFISKKQNTIFPLHQIKGGDIAGIYKISFKDENENYCYIGQSININKRLKSHYGELLNFEHHNEIVQKAWLKNPASFEYKIIEKVPINISNLEKQIFLFEKELEHIQKSETQTANKISADLVFTKEASKEFKKILEYIKKQMKKQRIFCVFVKEKIGELFIELEIIKEIKISGFVVKASNVLTWINKTRWGKFDYIPPIKRSHILFEPLKDALNVQQQKISRIDSEKKFLKSFETSFKKKGKYDTCEIDNLYTFKNIVEQYKNLENFETNINDFYKVHRSKVVYNSSLERILPQRLINILIKEF